MNRVVSNHMRRLQALSAQKRWYGLSADDRSAMMKRIRRGKWMVRFHELAVKESIGTITTVELAELEVLDQKRLDIKPEQTRPVNPDKS